MSFNLYIISRQIISCKNSYRGVHPSCLLRTLKFLIWRKWARTKGCRGGGGGPPLCTPLDTKQSNTDSIMQLMYVYQKSHTYSDWRKKVGFRLVRYVKNARRTEYVMGRGVRGGEEGRMRGGCGWPYLGLSGVSLRRVEGLGCLSVKQIL